MSGRRGMHPMDRLSIAFGVAARNVHYECFRKQAAVDAERIPICNAEIGGGRRGEMARLGRRTLASLADATEDQFEDKAQVLRGCADAVASRFVQTSEVSLGDRRRRQG